MVVPGKVKNFSQMHWIIVTSSVKGYPLLSNAYSAGPVERLDFALCLDLPSILIIAFRQSEQVRFSFRDVHHIHFQR